MALAPRIRKYKVGNNAADRFKASFTRTAVTVGKFAATERMMAASSVGVPPSG
jgi:hypothetical protein